MPTKRISPFLGSSMVKTVSGIKRKKFIEFLTLDGWEKINLVDIPDNIYLIKVSSKEASSVKSSNQTSKQTKRSRSN